jgi:flavin reductase (DIM6/NTAB) family NADH-FMN oxidoreductase RutF
MKVIKPGSTDLYPVPAVLVTCGPPLSPGGAERPNIITLAWVGTLCSDPPAVGIGVRPERFSHHLIEEVGEFVVNLPSADQLSAVDYCGQVSGRHVDKWAACGLTPLPASKVRPPVIAECPVALECRVIHRLTLGSHDLFVGQVLAVQVDETVLTAHGHIDYERAQPLTYAGGHYWRVGELLGRYGDWRQGGIKKSPEP